MSIILDILKKELVISLKEAVMLLGNKMAVYRLVEKGEISKVHPFGLGFFTLPSIDDGVVHFAVVAKYYPDCVVSGKTAMSLYGLGQDYIDKIDVDLPSTLNISNELLNVHRIVKSKINNVIKRDFKEKGINFNIKIYSPERVLHELYKYSKGTDAFYRGIKEYRRSYLNIDLPGEQYNVILSINKKIGQEIVNYLLMDEANE